jgi:CspA family cold shock protein
MSEGTVKWFNEKRGYGFLSTPDGGDVFVRYSDISGDGFKTLSEGECVSFELVESENGLRAENVVQQSGSNT